MNVPGPDRPTLIAIYRKLAEIKLDDDRFIGLMKSGNIVAPQYSTHGQ